MRRPIMLSHNFPTFCSFGRQNLFDEKASPFQDFVIPALDQETYGEFLRFGPGLGVFTLERFSYIEEDSWKASLFQDFVIPALDQETYGEFLQWGPGLGVFTLERFSRRKEDSRVSVVEGNLKPNQCTASALSVFEPTNQKKNTSQLWTCPGCGHQSERFQDFMQRPSVGRISIIQTRQQSAQSSKTQVHERSSSCSSDSSSLSSDFEKEIEELKERNIRLIQDFIIPALDQETYGDLLEWDFEPGVFKIKWTHKTRSSWTEEDFGVFIPWNQLKGRPIPQTHQEFVDSKQRLRAALRNLRTIEDVPSNDV